MPEAHGDDTGTRYDTFPAPLCCQLADLRVRLCGVVRGPSGHLGEACDLGQARFCIERTFQNDQVSETRHAIARMPLASKDAYPTFAHHLLSNDLRACRLRRH